MMSPLTEYKKQLGLWLEREPDEVFLFWKARVAFYAILKAMDVSAGDEVILPAYTCVVVPNAVLYLGAKPVYVDIDSETYNIDVSKLKDAITDRTKVIVCQNTYGLAPDLESVVALANERGIYTIEDSAHGMGGRYKGRPNGFMTDAAFFSTQWNKAFSTGIGGFAVVNSKYLQRKLQALENEASPPSFLNIATLQLLYWVRFYLINNFTYNTFVSIYRFLSKNNLIVGSSSGEEISSIQIPNRYFQAFSNLQARKGIKTLRGFEQALRNRREAATAYSEFLCQHDKRYIGNYDLSEHTFLKYPILVKDRAQFMKLAIAAKVQLGDWFKSPLHPVEKRLELWGLDVDNYPISQQISSQVINLPTELSQVPRTLSFLESNLQQIQ